MGLTYVEGVVSDALLGVVTLEILGFVLNPQPARLLLA
jgi:hypothetical protein